MGIGSRNHFYTSDIFPDVASAQEACANGIQRGVWHAAQ
jgi:hypothetical protein